MQTDPGRGAARSREPENARWEPALVYSDNDTVMGVERCRLRARLPDATR